jgi:hypothetical protein
MKRNRKRAQARAHKGPLHHAHNQLCDAIQALTAPQPATCQGRIAWTPSRYNSLRDATTSRAHGSTTGSSRSRLPCWIDALKLIIKIDTRIAAMTETRAPTPALLRGLARAQWRPQDTELITTIAAELEGFAQAIDDLFAPKPVYLPDPCPHCGQTHTHKLTDDGQKIRTPALAVSVDRGAWCQACHDRFDPWFLARLLDRRHEGISA